MREFADLLAMMTPNEIAVSIIIAIAWVGAFVYGIVSLARAEDSEELTEDDIERR